jgi:DNA-binding MarR family transcriptional regulator
MEKKGLIVRNKDLRRKNMIRVSMTEKGEELYKKVYKEDSLERMVDSLTEEQKQSLWQHLNILRDKSLEGLKIEQKPPLPE